MSKSDDLLIRNFMADHMTKRACDESEIFQAYAKIELAREASEKAGKLDDAERQIDEENRVFDQLDAFRKKVAESPALARKFKMAKAALEANPELAKKVDSRFIDGIKLLDIEE
jgi:hypothetical protein